MRDQLSWSGRWCRGKGWSLPGGGGWLSPGGSQTHRPTTVPAGAGLCSADTDCSAASQRAGSPSAWESRIKNSMKGQTRAGGKGMPESHMLAFPEVEESVSHSVIFDSLWPMDCSPPGSSVHEILQARILEWVVMPSSRGSYPPRDWTCLSCIGRQIPYHWATWEARLQDVKHRSAVFEEGAVNPVALLR